MMRRALAALAEGAGAGGSPTLARALAVPEAMAEQLLADLERTGYLARLGPEEGKNACQSCAEKTACRLAAPRLWQLTAKGWRAAKDAQTPEEQASPQS